MILARLALLPAAAAAATAGLAGLSSFLTTAGDETEDDIALFLFTARGVVVTSTELWAVAAKTTSHGKDDESSQKMMLSRKKSRQ